MAHVLKGAAGAGCLEHRSKGRVDPFGEQVEARSCRGQWTMVRAWDWLGSKCAGKPLEGREQRSDMM